MKSNSRVSLFALLLLLIVGCSKEDRIEVVDESPDKYGIEYLYHSESIPQIHITVPLEQWNALLAAYDANSHTRQYVSCDVTLVRDGKGTEIKGAGLRLRGNTSRRRPENGSGEHIKDKADWQHCHFSLNFDYYTRDEAHEINGARGIWLKWFKDDPTYTREIYCYDLFRRAGVWTAVNSAYCRLWIRVEGDSKEAYYGVYEMLEPINGRYLKARKDSFETASGNLWKCRYPSSLSSTDDNLFGADDGSDKSYTYEYKTDSGDFASAKEQIKDFILKVKGKSGDSFKTWMAQVCDVPLLLKTYAVNVTVGMWDDYWKNSNNWYLYFNTTDKYDYKFFFIPYDYDNTLGTSSLVSDSGTQNPFTWGNNDNPLIYKILQVSEFREIYRQELLKLVGEDEGLFYYTSSMERIAQWQSKIEDYVDNDTGQDCSIYDKPASWGNQSDYRIMSSSADGRNFFKVRTETIIKYCK